MNRGGLPSPLFLSQLPWTNRQAAAVAAAPLNVINLGSATFVRLLVLYRNRSCFSYLTHRTFNSVQTERYEGRKFRKTYWQEFLVNEAICWSFHRKTTVHIEPTITTITIDAQWFNFDDARSAPRLSWLDEEDEPMANGFSVYLFCLTATDRVVSEHFTISVWLWLTSEMADALSLLRQFTIENKEYATDGDRFVFNDLAYPKDIKTNYLVYGYVFDCECRITTFAPPV